MNGQETEKGNLTEASPKAKKAEANVAGSPGRATRSPGIHAGNDGAKAGRRRKTKNSTEAEQIQKDKVAAREKIRLQIGRLESFKALV